MDLQLTTCTGCPLYYVQFFFYNVRYKKCTEYYGNPYHKDEEKKTLVTV